MLTPRENFLETITGGVPDRLVNQFEALAVVNDPIRADRLKKGEPERKDSWGVLFRFEENDAGSMPIVNEDTKVCTDISQWQKYVKAPDTEFSKATWRLFIEEVALVDKNNLLVTAAASLGIFERLHCLMGFEDTLVNFLLEPEAMHELIDYIAAYRMAYFKLLVEVLNVEAVISHDDWGSRDRLFMSADMWAEFLKPAYEKFYSYLKSNGIIVIHHADSYLEPIVSDMADIGVDVWQGVLPSNNIPKIQQELQGRMALMGGLDAAVIDVPNWNEKTIRNEVERACGEYTGGGMYIPSITYGIGKSLYSGVYEIISDEINKQNKINRINSRK